MHHFLKIITLIGTLLAITSPAFAELSIAEIEQYDEAQTAKSIVDAAIATLKQKGQQKAFNDFNAPEGKFAYGQFYLIVFDEQGIVQTHSQNGFIGKNFMRLKDFDRQEFMPSIISAAQNNAEGGWSHYQWLHPKQKKVLPKYTFSKKFQDLIFVTGFYLNK